MVHGWRLVQLHAEEEAQVAGESGTRRVPAEALTKERKRSGIVGGANPRFAGDAVRFEREWKSHRAGHRYR
jgi:hypothetical protein